MRKLKLALLCAASIFTCSSNAATTAYMRFGGYDMDLAPQEEVDLKNPFFLSLTAKCTVNFSEEGTQGNLWVALKSKSATINDTKLDKDNSNLVFSIKHGDVFRILAAPGAAVTLKNQSEDIIKASCSIG